MSVEGSGEVRLEFYYSFGWMSDADFAGRQVHYPQ